MSTPNRSSLPGERMLALARVVFDETALETILVPAVADLQREVGVTAGARSTMRIRLRAYAALWVVFAVAAFVPGAGAGAPMLTALAGRNGGFLLVVLAPMLFAAVWPTFGAFSAGAAVAGLVFSFVVRAWNDRHPVTVARRQRTGPGPEINLSGIPVGGDAAGFLFVLASVMVTLGLPSLRGFVAGAVLAAVLLAYGLAAWRRRHAEPPTRRLVVS